MKNKSKGLNYTAILLIALLACGLFFINASWGYEPAVLKDNAFHIRTFDGNTEVLSIESAKRVYRNQSGLFEIWQYENNADVKVSINWEETDMTTETTLFAISSADADMKYLPADSTQTALYYCGFNPHTQQYAHFYFYDEVVLGNGEAYQNLLFVMKEYE